MPRLARVTRSHSFFVGMHSACASDWQWWRDFFAIVCGFPPLSLCSHPTKARTWRASVCSTGILGLLVPFSARPRVMVAAEEVSIRLVTRRPGFVPLVLEGGAPGRARDRVVEGAAEDGDAVSDDFARRSSHRPIAAHNCVRGSGWKVTLGGAPPTVGTMFQRVG